MPPATPADPLRLGGLTPLTTIDFPGRLAAVLYCQGCPWRCGYCHNPGLLDATAPPALPWTEALAFLQRRRGLLDGVVFSGGEPTLQATLPAAIEAVRGLGFAVALHTGGMYPQRLAALAPQLDWVGLDIKAAPAHYDAITATPGSGGRAWAALDVLLASGVPFECRTTWHAGLYDLDALHAIADALRQRGVRHWAVQACRTAAGTTPGWPMVAEQVAALRAGFEGFALRGA
ncbi:MAG: anaerobic ribonucleoside-triphosphate reductase activating protein [Proteobacteria bacterium]|nr:anaerobic ribonucleoside-triphosphate reductase activating protein [Pseudomonadota bacterium]